jgi:cell division protein FtsB
MHVDVGIWDKLTRVVIFLVFIAGLLGVAVWYLPLIQRNERMRKEIIQLDTQIQKEEATGRQLRVAINALSHDTNALARLIRERLGYGKAGETVIRFGAAPTNTTVYP